MSASSPFHVGTWPLRPEGGTVPRAAAKGPGGTRCPLSPNPGITPMTRSGGDGGSDRSDSSVAADGRRISSAQESALPMSKTKLSSWKTGFQQQ
ncbi:hypothetical protein AV530_019179 [Patagioenas fasciata monilis]|uniref:Uncharacterized protein n=1 Tax=Patagioenas fasciata monilis TaxID=372326 RepID=A0A1V4KXG1_PATFA|nr:hypothetical protein AV530_019179 [Patagioenas fasciata monilis]